MACHQTVFVDLASGDTISYTYDAVGNVSTKTDETLGITWTYSYNDANQMLTATETYGSSTLNEITLQVLTFQHQNDPRAIE